MTDSDGFRFPDVVPYLYYPDATAAVEFLVASFGFQEHSVVRGDDGAVWTAQLRTGSGLVMVGPGLEGFGTRAVEPGSPATCRIHVLVDDVDAHHRCSIAAGVEVDEPPRDHGPVRIYIAHDIGSHQWIFAQPIDI